jgi:ABC-type protease/lipase transport system fused ATPase/permease subunit
LSTRAAALVGFHCFPWVQGGGDTLSFGRTTQESLRAQISVVTQDTSLLHRSIRDNIRYGRPRASDVEVIRAAKLAHADEFIHELEDWKKRRGYDPHQNSQSEFLGPTPKIGRQWTPWP